MFDLLKVIIVGQFLASQNATITGEQSHAWMTADETLKHLAVGLARVVDETSNGALGSIEDHALIELHLIVVLRKC
jgi:hypothetical protein